MCTGKSLAASHECSWKEPSSLNTSSPHAAVTHRFPDIFSTQVTIGDDINLEGLESVTGTSDKKRKAALGSRADSWASRCSLGEIGATLGKKCCEHDCMQIKATFGIIRDQRGLNQALNASERRTYAREYLFSHSSAPTPSGSSSSSSAPGLKRSYWFQLDNNTGPEVRLRLFSSRCACFLHHAAHAFYTAA